MADAFRITVASTTTAIAASASWTSGAFDCSSYASLSVTAYGAGNTSTLAVEQSCDGGVSFDHSESFSVGNGTARTAQCACVGTVAKITLTVASGSDLTALRVATIGHKTKQPPALAEVSLTAGDIEVSLDSSEDSVEIVHAALPASAGQKAMAASFPVVLASDQSAIPISGTVAVTGVATEATLSAIAGAAATEATLANVATEATASQIQTDTSSIDGRLTTLVSQTADIASETTLGVISGKISACDTGSVTVAASALPAGAATAANQPAFGVAGTASGDVLTVQGVASMTALVVDGSAVTQPISASSLPLPAGAATESTLTAVASGTQAGASLIAAGLETSGLEARTVFGSNLGLTWHGDLLGHTTAGFQYAVAGSAGTLNIVSSDASDTFDVVVEGLDASLGEISETFTLTGTSPVTGSTSFLRVNNLYAAAVAGAAPVGTITLTRTSGGALEGKMSLNYGNITGHYTVPAGKKGTIARFTGGSEGASNIYVGARILRAAGPVERVGPFNIAGYRTEAIPCAFNLVAGDTVVLWVRNAATAAASATIVITDA